MKSRLFNRARTLIAAGLLVALGSSVSQSIENPGIYNPVDISTLPPSSYQIDPIRNPVHIDINGNLVITGNVRRGMHFRDTVPYDSTTSFRGTLGSSSLNSFLRDSAGSEDLDRSVNRYSVQPYYLQSRTVATTRPGYSGVFKPTGTTLNNQKLQGGFTTGTLVSDLEKQIISSSVTSTTVPVSQVTQTQYEASTNLPTIVTSLRELQLLTRQAESNISTKDQQLMIEKFRKQTQELQDNTKETQDSNQKFGISFEPLPVGQGLENKQQRAIEKYKSVKAPVPSGVTERTQTTVVNLSSSRRYPMESIPESSMTLAEKYAQTNAMVFQDGTISAESDTNIEAQDDIPSYDIVEQVKKQLEDLTKTIDEKVRQEPGLKSKDMITNIGLSSDAFKWGESSFNPPESVIEMLDIQKRLPQNDSSTKSKNNNDPHADSDTFPMFRFNLHYKAGQDHLKNGKYYAAADSFALASIFKRDDPLCLAGRGHALFAAGEYISSSLFLSRAIKADPEYIKAKINFAAMLGGQNVLDKRIADIKEWQLRSGSGNLDFLLGYVYYRMGRLAPAQKAINSAYTKLPQSKAVAIVKKAVNDALAGQ